MRATRADINLDRLLNNAALLQAKAGERQMMCIIKADAYGHGVIPVLHTLMNQGYRYFGVATFEEALELRAESDEIEILILGGITTSDIQLAHAKRIHVSLHHLSDLEMMEQHNLTGYCHLKIDSGMHRVGLQPKDIPDLAKRLIARKPVGIFTHLARADETDKTAAWKQIDTFKTVVDYLQSAGADFQWIHYANSAAILSVDLSFSNMVRAGIALYGLNPSPEVTNDGLQPLMRLVSRVSDVRWIEPGEGVSYSHRFIARQPTQIATLPLGYADGYKRQMSSNVEVFIRGQRCPQVGNITMDQIMIDVTGLDVSVGDEVELFGDQIHCDELAQAAGTINYEIVTTLGKRVRREYISGGDHGL